MKKQKDMQAERWDRLLASQERSKWIFDAHAYNPGWEDLGCYYIAGYGMTKGPAESIQVNEYDSDDASGWSASHHSFVHRWRVEANVKGQV